MWFFVCTTVPVPSSFLDCVTTFSSIVAHFVPGLYETTSWADPEHFHRGQKWGSDGKAPRSWRILCHFRVIFLLEVWQNLSNCTLTHTALNIHFITSWLRIKAHYSPALSITALLMNVWTYDTCKISICCDYTYSTSYWTETQNKPVKYFRFSSILQHSGQGTVGGKERAWGNCPLPL